MNTPLISTPAIVSKVLGSAPGTFETSSITVSRFGCPRYSRASNSYRDSREGVGSEGSEGAGPRPSLRQMARHSETCSRTVSKADVWRDKGQVWNV